MEFITLFFKKKPRYLIDFFVMTYLAVATKNAEHPPQLYGMNTAA
jgi:hypothetical protein